MHARVTSIQGTPAQLQGAVQQIRSTVPQAEQIEGFRGVYALTDAAAGRLLILTLWETEAAMFASAAAGRSFAQQVAQAAGATGEPEMHNFEVVIQPEEEGQRLAAALAQAARELEGQVRRVATSEEVTRLTHQVEGSLRQFVDWARHRGTPPAGGEPPAGGTPPAGA
jgi:heme-degrading monooxygenase HmoA